MAFTARTETYAYGSSLGSPYDVSIDKPTGTQNDDILFCLLAWYGATRIIDSVPSGWTKLGDNVANNDNYALYYKIASSEPSSYTWSFSESGRYYLVCSCYTGGDFDGADPIDVVSNTAYRETDYIVRAASMSAASANSPLVFWAAEYGDAARTFTKPSNPTTDWIEDDDFGDSVARFWAEICSMVWSGSGSTGNMDATCTFSMYVKHAFAVTLNPSGGATTYTKTVSMDALLRATDTEAIGLDALIRARDLESLSVDALLKGKATVTVLLDVLIGTGVLATASVSLDVILFKALPPNRIYTIEIRNGDGALLAILENAHGISYTQIINSPYPLTFDLPSDDSKVSNILLANECWLRDNRTDTVIHKFKLHHEMDMRT